MYIKRRETFILSKSSGGYLGLEDAFRDARSVWTGNAKKKGTNSGPFKVAQTLLL